MNNDYLQLALWIGIPLIIGVFLWRAYVKKVDIKEDIDGDEMAEQSERPTIIRTMGDMDEDLKLRV